MAFLSNEDFGSHRNMNVPFCIIEIKSESNVINDVKGSEIQPKGLIKLSISNDKFILPGHSFLPYEHIFYLGTELKIYFTHFIGEAIYQSTCILFVFER
jgi:hypothetical protein